MKKLLLLICLLPLFATAQSIKISALTSASRFTGNELFLIAKGTGNYKVTVETMRLSLRDSLYVYWGCNQFANGLYLNKDTIFIDTCVVATKAYVDSIVATATPDSTVWVKWNDTIPATKSIVTSYDIYRTPISLIGATYKQVFEDTATGRLMKVPVTALDTSSSTGLATQYDLTAKWDRSGNGFTDSTLFIGLTSNYPLLFKSNNSERMRLTKTGQLLINKTTNVAGAQVQIASPPTAYTRNGWNAALEIQGSGSSLAPAILISSPGGNKEAAILFTSTTTGTTTGSQANGDMLYYFKGGDLFAISTKVTGTLINSFTIDYNDGVYQNIGFGTGTPTYSLSFEGTLDKTIGLQAAASATAGKSLTLRGGDGTGTSKSGGNVYLTPGKNTGAATSNAAIVQRSGRQRSAGTSLDTLYDAVIVPAPYYLGDSTTANIFDITCGYQKRGGGEIRYSITVKDIVGATDTLQSLSGIIRYSFVQAAAGSSPTTTLIQVEDSPSLLPVGVGTLTSTWAATATANKVTIQCTPYTTVGGKGSVSADVQMNFEILNNSKQAITLY